MGLTKQQKPSNNRPQLQVLNYRSSLTAKEPSPTQLSLPFLPSSPRVSKCAMSTNQPRLLADRLVSISTRPILQSRSVFMPNLRTTRLTRVSISSPRVWLRYRAQLCPRLSSRTLQNKSHVITIPPVPFPSPTWDWF